MVTYLKSASGASYDVINTATINRNGSLIKAIVCIGIVVLNQHNLFLSHNIIYFSHMMVKSSFSIFFFAYKMTYISYKHDKYAANQQTKKVCIFIISKTHNWSVIRKT